MLKNRFHTRMLFETPRDGGDGGDGGSSSEDDDDIVASFQRLLARYDTPEKTAFKLYRENFGQREQLRKLAAEKEAAEAKVAEMAEKTPPEGSLALTPEQAEIWKTAIAELESPAKLPELLGEYKSLQARVAEQERDEILREVSAAANVKFEVLKDLDKSQGGLVYEVTPANGSTLAKVVIKTPTGDVDFSKFVSETWAHYLPALEAPAGSNFRFPRQSAGSPSSGSGILDSFIQRQQESAAAKPNPLRRTN